MDEFCPQRAQEKLPDAPARYLERRRHPRTECIARLGPVPGPSPDHSKTARPTVFRRMLVRVGLATNPEEPLPYGARIVAERDRRMPELAARLEAILEELDHLEAWREASDVCSAIERLRARQAESSPAWPAPPPACQDGGETLRIFGAY